MTPGSGRTGSLWPLAEGGGKLFCEDLKRGVWESPWEEQELPLSLGLSKLIEGMRTSTLFYLLLAFFLFFFLLE